MRGAEGGGGEVGAAEGGGEGHFGCEGFFGLV